LLILFNQILAKGFDGHHYIAGLASHFRDLLVCQSPETIALLEVGEQTKVKYQNQSQKAQRAMLIKGIEMANDCDLKYKTSKNQRLLVELTLMQLASITYDGEKKKNLSRFIIPPSFFRKQGIKPVSVASTQPDIDVNKIADTQIEAKRLATSSHGAQERVPKISPPVLPKIDLNASTKRTSGLSLKSIRAKKEHLIKQKDAVVDDKNLPTEAFTEDAFLNAWNDFIVLTESKREMNLASILSLDKPRLNNTSIHLTFPNETNKIELERESFEVLNYLRKRLKNYSISFNIEINEVLQKKYAYTPKEKYEKFIDKNPSLELLRNLFDLDV
jgi:DNA polymerase-3 subunit gamma/tau